MKKYYYKNIILLIAFFCGNSVSSIAQVQDDVINDPGDIAIVSYHGGTTAQPMLAFVLLDNCPANTVITFTDEEYLSSTGPFNSSSEGELVWTSPNSSIARGTVVRLQPAGSSTIWTGTGVASLGTSTATSGFVMNTNDQVYAFIGTMASPTFLTAFGNLACTGGSAGCIPSTLTSGTTARNISTASPNHQTYYTGGTTCNGTIAVCSNMIYTGTWSTSTGVSSYPANFTGTALPIELIRFEGNKKEGYNHLSWTTASETQNKGFDIERSTDGVRFEKFGFVKGAGTTTKRQDYRFTDEKLAQGNNYYRLKQLDFDGRFEYSKIIAIAQNGKKVLSIFPNPSNGLFTITGLEDINNDDLTVINSIGQTLFIALQNDNQLDLSAYPSGVYYLRVASSGQVMKLVKE
jgi:hypothetical protein